MKFVYL